MIIGRAQNPWLECNLKKMSEENVLLVRRQSGGGAVYHDLGNLNFSILSNLKFFNKTQHLLLIIQALEFFKIKALMGPRHDLWVEHENKLKKFSGCAFRQTKDKAFHHGTLLINTDLDKLATYLKSPEENKISAKGVKSVRSPVINLSELRPDLKIKDLIDKISEIFLSDYCDGVVLPFEGESYLTAKLLDSEREEEFKKFDWLYGKTLPFEIIQEIKLKNTLGQNELIKVNLLIEQGLIEKISLENNSENKSVDQRLNFLLGQRFLFF